MEGLIIKFIGSTRNIVKELLNDISVLELEFDINHWESYGDDIDGSKFDFNNIEKIPSDLIKNKVFIEDYIVYPEFMELFARPKEGIRKEIFYYKDFIESHYIISIINYDYRNIEICCKIPEILEIIKNNFLKSNLQEKRIKEIYNIPPDAVLQAWRQGKGIGD